MSPLLLSGKMVITTAAPIFCKSTTFTVGIPCRFNLFHSVTPLRLSITVIKSKTNAYLLAKLICLIASRGVRKDKNKINCLFYLKQFIL